MSFFLQGGAETLKRDTAVHSHTFHTTSQRWRQWRHFFHSSTSYLVKSSQVKSSQVKSMRQLTGARRPPPCVAGATRQREQGARARARKEPCQRPHAAQTAPRGRAVNAPPFCKGCRLNARISEPAGCVGPVRSTGQEQSRMRHESRSHTSVPTPRTPRAANAPTHTE